MDAMTQPLSGIKVVDFTHERAGPYCTRLLAGYGAQVLKIERPATGDLLRHVAPFVNNQGGLERGLAFHWLNAGKQSLTLDLKSEQGLDIARRLVAEADVVVESFSPGTLQRLGLAPAEMRASNPGLVVTSISNFGQTGPYRDFRADETVLYAMSGCMVATGDPDRPPLDSGPAIALYTGGLHAYIATLMALFRTGFTGRGEHVDVSLQESSIENIELQLAVFLSTGKVARRNGDDHPFVPWRCYPCKDGYAAVIGGPMRHWHKAADLFEEPELADPELAHVYGRVARRERVENLIKPWLMATTGKEIYHKGQALGLAFGYLASMADALESPQHAAREFLRECDEHPEVGRLSMCAAPFRIEGTDWTMGRAPILGEHTAAALGDWLAMDAADVAALRDQGVV
ncbi:CoA transferase [Haliea sp. E1-2-M8]|uniref:CaiB/BaiF CoA transferase family protein n=1 Tax=Haliea sp. E1-2-M8 TaxID=3064706 RepID=UPI0027209F65|nr:CoA transferase [Haliea sp. E1-2-M8]MDO8861545.1 CoA transferase [Haliea sp. E1-2-M8]